MFNARWRYRAIRLIFCITVHFTSNALMKNRRTLTVTAYQLS